MSTWSRSHLHEQQGQDQPFGVSHKGDGGKFFRATPQTADGQFRLGTGNNAFPGMVGWRWTGSPSLAVSEVTPSPPLSFLLG